MNPRTLLTEGLASLVVFLVALPLCMGVAVACEVPAEMGLASGIIGGLVVGLLAGSPLQVSGPAAGLIAVVLQIKEGFGVEMIGPILLLAGLMQAAAGALKFGQWFRAVAPAVIYGMLAGIGVLIFASQFHVMFDHKETGTGLQNLARIPGRLLSAIGDENQLAAGGIALLTIVILVVWNGLKPKLPAALGALPAPLLAVIAAIAVSAGFGLDNIAHINVTDNLRAYVNEPSGSALARLADPSAIAMAFALAAVASAEACICALAVDKLHDGPRSDLNRELLAQGVGNTLAGAIGALPVTGVIVRSTANVESGSRTRLSAILHGLWLLLAIAAVPFALNAVPTACLAAILVYIGWRLVDLKKARALLERGRGEFALYFITVSAIAATDLLTGLLIGFGLSLAKLAWSFSHMGVRVDDTGSRVDVHLRGSGTFVGLPSLASDLESLPAEREVHIHLEHVDFVDHACFELIADWRKQYESRGGTVILEWDTLAERSTYRAKAVEAA